LFLPLFTGVRGETVRKGFLREWLGTLPSMRRAYQTDLSDAEWSYVEPHLPTPKAPGRPRLHAPREILDAIFYIVRSGCACRLLPHDFPPWKNGGKKVKGRKRHLLVDTEGLVLKATVHSAKVMDYEGIKILLAGADQTFPRLRHLWLDGGYRGEDKGKDWVEKTLGWNVDLVEHPKKPAPKEVLMTWARESAKEGVALDWQKFMPQQGFVVLPRGGGWWKGRFLGSTRTGG
jgi:putative transposase